MVNKKEMKSFKEYIEEARRNPDLNQHVSIIDNLRQYKDDSDIFISFVEHLGPVPDSAGIKIGINPHSAFSTPAGVYTYPLKKAWREYRAENLGEFDVPFAGNRPYVAVLKKRGNGISAYTYKATGFKNDVEKLKKWYMPILKRNLSPILPSFMNSDQNTAELHEKGLLKMVPDIAFDMIIEYSKNAAYIKSPLGWMWNITRVLSLLQNAANTFYIQVEYDEMNDDFHFLLELGRTFAIDAYIYKKDLLKKPSKFLGIVDGYIDIDFDENSAAWNKIFREVLGYEYVIDEGRSVIHTNEPTQAVFFSNKGYTFIDAFKNKGEKRHKR
jgi:hypothetical protein